MADVLNKTTTPADYRRSVNSPDFDPAAWFINPDVSAVANVPTKYWMVGVNPVTEMTQLQKDAVDAALVAANKSGAKTSATSAIDGNSGYDKRAVASVLVDEINNLRQWITAFKAATAAATSLGNLQTRVAALNNMPDRTLAQAKAAYKNAIAGSGLDK